MALPVKSISNMPAAVIAACFLFECGGVGGPVYKRYEVLFDQKVDNISIYVEGDGFPSELVIDFPRGDVYLPYHGGGLYIYLIHAGCARPHIIIRCENESNGGNGLTFMSFGYSANDSCPVVDSLDDPDWISLDFSSSGTGSFGFIDETLQMSFDSAVLTVTTPDPSDRPKIFSITLDGELTAPLQRI